MVKASKTVGGAVRERCAVDRVDAILAHPEVGSPPLIPNPKVGGVVREPGAVDRVCLACPLSKSACSASGELVLRERQEQGFDCVATRTGEKVGDVERAPP